MPTCSSSFSHHLYPSLYLSFNNVFQKAVPTQDMTNPFSLSSFLLYVWYSSWPWPHVTPLFLARSAHLISITVPDYTSKQPYIICNVSQRTASFRTTIRDRNVRVMYCEMRTSVWRPCDRSVLRCMIHQQSTRSSPGIRLLYLQLSQNIAAKKII
jgi:hypothetical protein